ncbi:MAG TPA: mycothiol system anti-sigma-R factor, partial [Candidatus Sulfotelmatobacter sp.]|nr:mycothiol system anti-sigma-R factor [Candidatus Sulfotelmatobacter sp.]
MSCDYTRTALHGYLDGELDASRSAEFERHLEGCRECSKLLETEESLRSVLQRSSLCESAPPSLRKKIRAELDAATSVPITEGIAVWRWVALAASILLVAAISWYAWPGSGGFATRNPAPPPFTAAELIDAHIRSLQPGHLTDVASTDQHTVKPWFDGKLDFAPPVKDYADDGFPLVGGRLDVLGGRNVAVLVYARRKHFI